MTFRKLFIAGLVTLPLAVACQDRRAQETTSPTIETTPSGAQATRAPAPAPDPAAPANPELAVPTAPHAEERGGTTDTAGTMKDTTAQNERAPAKETQAAMASEEPSASADLTGEKARGRATFRVSEGKTRMMVDVRDAPKGRYELGIIDGTDCNALSDMETPYKGGPGTAGEAKKGGPDAKTTAAMWKSLAALDIGEGGKGTIEIELDDKAGTTFTRRMVVMRTEGWKDSPSKTAFVACGPITAVKIDKNGQG